MRLANSLGITLLLGASLSYPARAGEKKSTPDPNSVTIESVNYSGTGCPKGSLATAITNDAQTFIFIFSSLYAQTGPGVSPSEAKKQCQIHIKLSVPPNWSYALTTVDYRGYTSLDPSVSASQAMTYHMSGESPDSTAAFSWQGALDGEYAVTDIGGQSPPYWSRCGGGKNLMIRTDIDVDNSANLSGSGLLEVDTSDGQMVHVSWQRCQ
jgi:hypothetical protein